MPDTAATWRCRPCATATGPAAAPIPTLAKRTDFHALQTIHPAIWADARARDALPARRPAMGREYRHGSRPGVELAARCFLLPWADGRGDRIVCLADDTFAPRRFWG